MKIKRENLDNFGFGDDFQDTSPKAQSIKEIFDKLDLIKLKYFSVKDNIKTRREATYWEKIMCERYL